MKRILAFILVLLMIVSVFASCDAFTPSPEETEKKTEASDEKETEKETEKVTEKETDNGNGGNGNGNNGSATVCDHVDDVTDHICDKCGASVGVHADRAGDGDHKCDHCKALMAYCEDEDKDHDCDECGAILSAHSDPENDGDHKCDYCQAVLTACTVDSNKDHNCDECGALMSVHFDSVNDGDHKCDYCKATLAVCNDSNRDHKCDECAMTLSSCADSSNDGDHKCDYCGKISTSCVNTNNDHSCDECGATPVHNYQNGKCIICDDCLDYERTGSKITFGFYPQTKVTDATLTATLNGKVGTLPTSTNSQAWTSYGYYINGSVSNYMWYIDVTNGNDKYRGVYFASYRPYCTGYSSSADYTHQDDNGYTVSTVYWFKYEPISWTILSEDTANGTALILCDMIIDSQQFDFYSINYAESTIRGWLNETFYNAAFNDLQKQMIITTTVDNGLSWENTQDKIFLLSYQDVTNSNYGFSSDYYSTDDTARQKKTTDYAQAQGAYTSTSSNGYWWLRSPYYYYSGVGEEVYTVGTGRACNYPNYTDFGVVPALQIRL